MNGRLLRTLAVLVGAGGLITACTSSHVGPPTASIDPSPIHSSPIHSAPEAFNAATTGVVNVSSKTGGSVNLLAGGDCDSWDPANTYYSWCWNLQRLFTRTLVGFSTTPGATGVGVEADLATGLGEHNSDFTEWTYHLRDAKWEDGHPITSKEIKYGLERVFATDVFTQGPASYYLCLLSKCDANGNSPYGGPYRDKTGGLDSIATPDDRTVVFTLQTSSPDFDYLMAMPAAAPVPLSENGSYTGARYALHPMSDGPYKFSSYVPEQKAVWVRNPNWDQTTDNIRTPHADTFTLTINANADDTDKQLRAGAADALADGGVDHAFETAIANSPELKNNADDPVSSYTRYFAVFPQVAPLDNVHCRRAIFYALNKADLQLARGGPFAAEVARTMAQPSVPGYDPSADPYPSGSDNTGDLKKARSELSACGRPNGFSVKEAYVDSGRGPATFTSSRNALARVGIEVTPATHAQSGFYGGFIGSPATVRSVGIGLAQAGWGADIPSGSNFWTPVAASSAPPGGGNYSQLNDPKVDALLKAAAQTAGRRDDLFKQVDAEVMADAVMLPFAYDKTLFYRNPRLTNVRTNYANGSYYDFVNVGVSN